MAVDRVDVVSVQTYALLPAQEDAADAMDVEEHALGHVEVDALADAEVDALADAEDVVGVQDAEDHVQAHAQQVEKARLVLHAIAAPDALVHVLRVLRVVDVVAVVDVVGVAAVHPVATAVVSVQEDALDYVVVDAQEDAAGAQEDAPGAQGAVLDVTDRVLEHAMAVVTDVVDNAKTHALPHAQQHVLEPAKLKHLVLWYREGVVCDPTVDLIANGMMKPVYSKALHAKYLPGGGYANNSNYELKDLGISVRYDKENSEILFDLSNGLTVIDNTIFKQLGYKLPIPLFIMLNDSNITYNPNHVGSSDNYWPSTIENADGLVINSSQGYQIEVDPNVTAQANKKGTKFTLTWYKYNTTKNYPEVGSTFKGTKVIRIPFKITGI